LYGPGNTIEDIFFTRAGIFFYPPHHINLFCNMSRKKNNEKYKLKMFSCFSVTNSKVLRFLLINQKQTSLDQTNIIDPVHF